MLADLRSLFRAIYEEKGALTPRIVVEAARAPGHDLHERYFGTSDEDAAEEWRLLKAADDIRSVRFKVLDATEEYDGSIRYWQISREEDRSVYRPVDEIAKNPLTAELMLRDAERAWRDLFARYQHLQEFVELVRASVSVPRSRRRAG